MRFMWSFCFKISIDLFLVCLLCWRSDLSLYLSKSVFAQNWFVWERDLRKNFELNLFQRRCWIRLEWLWLTLSIFDYNKILWNSIFSPHLNPLTCHFHKLNKYTAWHNFPWNENIKGMHKLMSEMAQLMEKDNIHTKTSAGSTFIDRLTAIAYKQKESTAWIMHKKNRTYIPRDDKFIEFSLLSSTTVCQPYQLLSI